MREGYRSSGSGFTLVECLIAVAVLAILTTSAIPAYTSMLTSHLLATQANDFLAALNLARSEAIKRNGRVVVCKSVAGEDCEPDAGWEQGWIVFDDRNNNANLDGADELLRRVGALAEGFVMVGNTPVAEYVSYTPLGLTKTTSGAFQAGTLTLCKSTAGNEGRQIVIGITGRPRVKKVSAAACT